MITQMSAKKWANKSLFKCQGIFILWLLLHTLFEALCKYEIHLILSKTKNALKWLLSLSIIFRWGNLRPKKGRWLFQGHKNNQRLSNLSLNSVDGREAGLNPTDSMHLAIYYDTSQKPKHDCKGNTKCCRASFGWSQLS